MSKITLTNLDLLVLSWRTTAGWKGIFHGVEAWVSLFVFALTSPFWLYSPWWDQVLAILPGVLGFTLSGYAIFLGFGSDSFKMFLAQGDDPDNTPYMSVGAAFLLFVSLQLTSVLYALVVKALQFPLPDALHCFEPYLAKAGYVASGIGYLLFIYSLALSLRAALRIFRLSRWYNHFLRLPESKNQWPRTVKRIVAASSFRQANSYLSDGWVLLSEPRAVNPSETTEMEYLLAWTSTGEPPPIEHVD